MRLIIFIPFWSQRSAGNIASDYSTVKRLEKAIETRLQ